MAARLLEGKPVAEAVLTKVSEKIKDMTECGVTPGLGTILVGDNEASGGYVRKKHETCQQVGIVSFNVEIPVDATQPDLLAAIDRLNQNPNVDGFLIQHPLPPGFDFNEALMRMDPAKDADGLHPVNLGKLVLQENGPLPCTPAGIRAMLNYYEVPLEGRNVVIVGRGPTLGRPLSLLLTLKQGANAAVTVVHSGVVDLERYTRKADIVVAAVGVPGFIKPEMIKPGAAVVSGGISWKGRTLLADVDESVGEVAGWITPRLGGVGPTTVAMLMQNTVQAAKHRLTKKTESTM